MPKDDDEDTPAPILACGHPWDGTEDWADLLVILKETLDGPDGPQPAYSTGHHCRAGLPGERFRSTAEANDWLRRARRAP